MMVPTPETNAVTCYLDMIAITKRFSGVTAVDHVDFQVMPGEIHALVGENGAGKTTLMRIAFGMTRPDGGQIRLKGERCEIRHPVDAIGLGICMIHQHFMLVPSFTVVENVALGSAPTTLGLFTDIGRVKSELEDIAGRYGIRVNLDARVRDLSVGELQRVEILKALYREVQLIILDEPTAVLTPQEAEGLFQMMREFAHRNKTIIFITHKLQEVKQVADRITVMRKGRVVGVARVCDVDQREIARMMVGRDVLFQVRKKPPTAGRTLLRLHGVTCRNALGLPALRNVSLEVRAGEIVGVAGVEGNGQRELVNSITGLLEVNGGRIFLDEEEITTATVRRRRDLGMSHIPEDRMEFGLCMGASVESNLIMGSHRSPGISWRGLFLRMSRIRDFAQKLIRNFNIVTPSARTLVDKLSGGNLQKVVLAREFSGRPKVDHCLPANARGRYGRRRVHP